MDFWDPEIMKIVFLLKRGLDLAFFEIFEKNQKIDAKRPPQIHVFCPHTNLLVSLEGIN